jgi:Fic family protein
VPCVVQVLNMTAPTARKSILHLVELGVLEEVSGKKRDKIYVYRNYLDILEDGAEPF